MGEDEEREGGKEREEDVRKHNSDQIAQHSRDRGSKVIYLCLSLTLFTLAENLTYNPKLNMIPSLSVSSSLLSLPPPLFLLLSSISLVINRAVITRQDQ